MTKYKVVVLPHAENDFKNIYKYIKRSDSVERAKYVADQIDKAVKSLEDCPSRGSYVNEFLEQGIKEFREIYFKPYRIIYTIVGNTVNVAVIADGRRSLKVVLERRLLKN